MRAVWRIAGLALVVAVVVVTSSSGDGGDKTADCPTIDTSQAQQAGVPVIPLEATEPAADGECSPAGQLTFAAQAKNQLALQLNAVGLKPTAQGEADVLWLYRDDQQSLPIGAQAVPADGNLTLTVPAPTQLAALIAGGAFQSVRVSLVTQADAQTIAQAQTQGKSAVIAFAGSTVLEGPLPQPSAAAQGGTGQAPQGGAGQAPQGGTGKQ